MKQQRIAIFASGGGSNAIQLHTYFKNVPQIELHAIYTNNSKAGIIEKGKEHGIIVHILTSEEIENGHLLAERLKNDQIDCIILAGYLKKIQPELIQAYPNKIINIHPALLPNYGGKGMYGMNVHKAVKLAEEKKSGITIHLVNENYDEGKHIAQFSCILDKNDSPEDIQQKVQSLEHAHFAPTVCDYLIQNL